MQKFNTQSLSYTDNFSFNPSLLSEPFFNYTDKEDIFSAFETNNSFEMVYSTPPSSPEKVVKPETTPQCQMSINPYTIPYTSIPMGTTLVSNEPFLSNFLNNGSIILPRTSIIAVDPLVYMQLLNSCRTNNIFSDLYPQLYSQMLYQQVLGQVSLNNENKEVETVTESPNPKKRKSSLSTNKKPQRRVRPKVVPEKGAIQCIGMNRKKNQRCRNAALMEFIGPRPKYCAEHIHLDPECLYMKCGSSYQKVPGDKKGCREVVLKEFGLCHKHYRDCTEKMVGEQGYKTAMEKLARVNSLLSKLESEAMKAKKTNADLYQRKNKLIPKFQDMKSILIEHINKLKKEEGFNEENN